MEQKLVRVPFNVELAKKITNKEIEGKIVTAGGRNARIVCWDLQEGLGYPIIALIQNGSHELVYTYRLNGIYNDAFSNGTTRLMLEIPEYLTFKDGDITVCGWEGQNKSSSWISIVKSVNASTDSVRTSDYVTLIVKSNNHSYGSLRYDSSTNSGEWIRRATKEERQKLIDALKASKESKAKEYLQRFFGIEEKPEYEFKPFDKVLVRTCPDMDIWTCDMYSHFLQDEDEGFCYVCIGGVWKECIPYNEQTAHLLGTTDDWER